MKFMKYFLIVGLMMMGSFARADICSPLWWQSATPPQVESEAQLKGPLAMNAPCPDGVMPLTLALENNNSFAVFSAITEHFDLDEEARLQIAEQIVVNIKTTQQRGIKWSISSLVELLNSPSPVLDISDEEYRRILLYFLSIPDEYEIIESIEGNPTIEIWDNR